MKFVIAEQKGGRGGTVGIPASLIHRDMSGHIPAPSTGLIIVSISEIGKKRRKAELASLKAALGLQAPWSLKEEPFLSSFADVRTSMVKQLQAELVQQLSLVYLLGYGGKALGKDTGRARKGNLAREEGIAATLLSRLKLWMKGEFLGLSSAVPEGALVGDAWQGNWADGKILKEKMTPWVQGYDGESDGASIVDSPAELGCVFST